MDITSHHIQTALANDVWTFANDLLYRLCREHPEHNKPEVVIAKIWLIGRTYAAAIERRRNKQLDNDSFYERKVAPCLMSARLDLDGQLGRLGKYEGIDARSIGAVLAAHKKLLDTLNRLTQLNKRSLASKYLHFHCPDLFYLYDTRAVIGLRRIKPGARVTLAVSGKNDFDPEYARFALKLLDLQEQVARDFRQRLTPRQLDRLLLKLAAERRT